MSKKTLQVLDDIGNRAKAKAELEVLGGEIVEHFASMNRFTAAAREKAGEDINSARQQYELAVEKLKIARIKCKAAGESFKTFQAKFAPDLKPAYLYELSGPKLITQVRAETAKRVRAHRARKNSVTSPPVTEKDSTSASPRMNGGREPSNIVISNDVDTKESTAERMAFYASAEAEPKSSPTSDESGTATRLTQYVAEALNNIPLFARRTSAEATPTSADINALFDHAVSMLLELVAKPISTFAGTVHPATDLQKIADLLVAVAAAKRAKAA